MRISNRLLLILNAAALGLLLYPLSFLSITDENYSTLSLVTRGYLYVLAMGILIAFILFYETDRINCRRHALIIASGIIIGVIVPHHYPHDLQGELHMLAAYLGGFIAMAVTFVSIMKNGSRKLLNLFMIVVTAVLLLYMKYQIFTVLSETLIMAFILLSNLLIYMKRFGH